MLALVGVGLLKYYSETYDVDYDRYLENYAVLGLTAEAPFADVKKAFHELSKKWYCKFSLSLSLLVEPSFFYFLFLFCS